MSLRDRLEQRLQELPVLPTILAQMLLLNPEDEKYFDRVHRLVETDPNFSARILASANSAASAPSNPVSTLRAAISRIGSANASNLIMAVCMMKVFVPRDDWEKSLWRHAIQVAIATRKLADRSKGAIKPEEAYICGLLHDVGRFVMFQETPDQLRRIDEGDWETAEALIESERMLCGLSHTELGALACTKWELPESIVSVVRDHHSRAPARGKKKSLEPLTSLVRVADIAMFPSAMPGTPGLAEADEETLEQLLKPKIPRFIKISTRELSTLIKTATEEADSIGRAIGVA